MTDDVDGGWWSRPTISPGNPRGWRNAGIIVEPDRYLGIVKSLPPQPGNTIPVLCPCDRKSHTSPIALLPANTGYVQSWRQKRLTLPYKRPIFKRCLLATVTLEKAGDFIGGTVWHASGFTWLGTRQQKSPINSEQSPQENVGENTFLHQNLPCLANTHLEFHQIILTT